MTTTMREMSKGRSDVFALDPRDIIVEDGFNTRTEDDDLRQHIADLKASIRVNGVLEPMTIRFDREKGPVLRHGHCRLRAVQELIAEGVELLTVPVRTTAKHSNEADDIAEILLRNDGMPLRPHETAAVLKRLAGLGWSAKQIADKIGRSHSYVNSLLSFEAAPEEVKKQVRDGKASVSTARKAIRKHGKDGAAAAIDKAAKKSKRKKATASNVDADDGPRRTKENFTTLVDALRAIASGEEEPAEYARMVLEDMGLPAASPVDEKKAA